MWATSCSSVTVQAYNVLLLLGDLSLVLFIDLDDQVNNPLCLLTLSLQHKQWHVAGMHVEAAGAGAVACKLCILL